MNEQNTQVVKTTDWIIAILLASIPIVNVIMLCIWAFGSETNINKKNWSKAMLIWMAIIIVLYILVFVVFGVAMMSRQY